MGSQGNQNNGNDLLVPGAGDALQRMKNEIANEQSLNLPTREDWGDVPSKDWGKVGGQIGGNMVREMIRMAEQRMAGQ